MPRFSTPSARWAAITARDPAASNAFIYCVTSTKIYCRPTCPARLARRANVVFHDTAAEAEADGYRACMRCRPGSIDESEGDPQRIAVTKACELVKKEGDDGEKRSVKSLAKEVGLTESHFCRVFKKIMGMTVGEYRASIVGKKDEGVKEVVPSKTIPVLWDNGGAVSSLQFSYIPDAVQARDSFMNLDSDLVQDWNDFSGTPNLFHTLDMFPGAYAEGHSEFSFPLEIISDASTPTTMDDGFQFLDFDAATGFT